MRGWRDDGVKLEEAVKEEKREGRFHCAVAGEKESLRLT